MTFWARNALALSAAERASLPTLDLDWKTEDDLYTAVDRILQARMSAQSARSPLGNVVQTISQTIDGTYPTGIDPEAHLWRRCMKITEEAGEVFQALAGHLGENARKGRTHDMHDVRSELLDVALAALAAISHFDDGDSIDYLDTHARTILGRLNTALAGQQGGGA